VAGVPSGFNLTPDHTEKNRITEAMRDVEVPCVRTEVRKFDVTRELSAIKYLGYFQIIQLFKAAAYILVSALNLISLSVNLNHVTNNLTLKSVIYYSQGRLSSVSKRKMSTLS
jgi:hypothetical protein